MIGFRSARRQPVVERKITQDMGVDGALPARDRSFANRLAHLVGEVGAAVETQRGGSSGERR
jgi:hypothetical protein